MCERLLNLQEIYVSGQNICIEVYGNSVGTITPYRMRIMRLRMSRKARLFVIAFVEQWDFLIQSQC